MELSQFLHVVNGELDCAFDLHITKLTTVDAHYTASDLQIPSTKTQIYTETISLLHVINVQKNSLIRAFALYYSKISSIQNHWVVLGSHTEDMEATSEQVLKLEGVLHVLSLS